MKNTLIVGGAGFIGTHLVEKLEKYNVSVLDKKPSTSFPDLSIVGDVRDSKTVEEAVKGKDIVVLLAAEHTDNVTPISLYYDVNVGGMKNVLEAMTKHNVKNIVFTSSVAIYGMNRKAPDEKASIQPFNNYGKSKWEAEKLLQKWVAEDSERNALILRPTVVFGERNRGNVYNLLKQICSNRFIMIGKGLNKKSMCYVENIVAFIEYQITNRFCGVNIYNFKDSPDMTMRELVEYVHEVRGVKKRIQYVPYLFGLFVGYCFDILSKLTGKKFAVSSIRVKKFCATTVFNSEKLQQSGFKAPYTLKQALKRTVEKEFTRYMC